MRDKAVLPNVERMLAVAAKKQAKAKRARRSSRGFMIIALAGLALTGSALAATGVWNPLGGDHHRAPDPASPRKSVGVQIGVAPSIQAPLGKSQGRRPAPDASGSGLATSASQVAAPVVDRGGAPVAGQGPGLDDAGPQGPLSIDDGKSTSGGSDDGPQVDPPGQQGDNPKGPRRIPAPRRFRLPVAFYWKKTLPELNVGPPSPGRLVPRPVESPLRPAALASSRPPRAT